AEFELLKDRVEHPPVYFLDIKRGVYGAHHHLERAAAIFVGDLGPVGRESVARAGVRECLAKTGVPVEYRSPSIERERLDASNHIRSPQFWCATGRAPHTTTAALAHAQSPRHLLQHTALTRWRGMGTLAGCGKTNFAERGA